MTRGEPVSVLLVLLTNNTDTNFARFRTNAAASMSKVPGGVSGGMGSIVKYHPNATTASLSHREERR